MSYTLIQQINDEHAHIKFEGPFQGKNVTWDTNFYTLNAYSAEQNIPSTEQKQFINIEPVDTNILKLTIALKIKKINAPNILKMIIMINQYKNLSIGRHDYG